MLHPKTKIVKKKGGINVVRARVGGANTTQKRIKKMKRRESESGQKFLSPNPLPFCPYEQNLFEKFSGILFKNSSSFVQNTPPRKKHHFQHGVFFLVELRGIAPLSKRETRYFLQAYQRLGFRLANRAAAKLRKFILSKS